MIITTEGNIEIAPKTASAQLAVINFIGDHPHDPYDIGVVDVNTIRIKNLKTGRHIDVSVQDFTQFNTGLYGTEHLIFCQVCGEFVPYATFFQNPESSEARMTKHVFATQHVCPCVRENKVTLPRLKVSRHPDAWLLEESAHLLGYLRWEK